MGLLARTGLTAVNPGATSRLTRRPWSSVIGASYSHRSPRFAVNPGLIRQSSFTYASYVFARRYLSALPNAIALVDGRPRRKSARSEPVAAPAKWNEPRAFC